MSETKIENITLKQTLIKKTQFQGRLRLYVKDNLQFKQAKQKITSLIKEFPEIRYQFNERLKTVLFVYSPQYDNSFHHFLLQLAENYSIIDDTEWKKNNQNSKLKDFKEILKKPQLSNRELKAAAAFIFMGLAVRQVSRGKILPPALPLLISAFQILKSKSN